MFIDIHAHAYLWPCPPQDGVTTFCNPAELVSYFDQLGIEKGFLLPLIGPETYLPQSNEEIMEICRRYPDRFYPCCNIDPRGIGNASDTDFSVWLNWYKDHGCKAVGEFMPNLPFSHPLVINFFKQVEKVGLPLIFDISDTIGGRYGLYDDPGLPQLEYCLRRFPNLKIFGHGPAFWSEIGQLETPGDRGGYPSYPVKAEGVVPKLFRRYDNLYGDLSAGSGSNAFLRDREYAVKFLNEFQDRLFFGSDICSLETPVRMVILLQELKESGDISEETFQKIARKNAIRIFNL